VHFVVYGYVNGVEGQRLVPVPIGFWNSSGVSIWSGYSMDPIPHAVPVWSMSSASLMWSA
jgi:hypothetical protein